MQMTHVDEEIDLIELWNVVWRGRWMIVAVTAVFGAIAVAYVLFATPWYRAEVLLMPAEQQSTSGLMAQFGGLAGLAGITVGSGDTAEPIAVLESQGFTRRFIEGESLLPVLLADEWDAGAKSWKDPDPADQPDWRDGVKFFEEEVRSVSKDASTGLVTLGVTWTEPQVAADWANKLVKRLNEAMRERALRDADGNVAYLRAELGATNVVAVQQAIGRLLESEMQKLMMARGKEEFALRVIDRAEPPKEPERPNKALIILLTGLAGGMLSVLFVILRQAARKRRAA